MTDSTVPTSVTRRASARLDDVRGLLDGVHNEITADEWLIVRASIGRLLAKCNDELLVLDDSLGLPSAQGRILRYFQLRVGTRVTKEEISGVAGIHAWARRVRELREDHGWVIHSAGTMGGLGPGEYVMTSDRPDVGLAYSWTLARRMRKLRTRGGVLPPRARVLEFLKELHPRAADREQLAHVAGSESEAGRIVEDLRSEGWMIELCGTDDVNVPGGVRLLERDRLSGADHSGS